MRVTLLTTLNSVPITQQEAVPGKGDTRENRDRFEAVLHWYASPDNHPWDAKTCAKQLGLKLNQVYTVKASPEFQQRRGELIKWSLSEKIPHVLHALSEFAVKEAKNQVDRRTFLQAAGVIDAKGAPTNALSVNIHNQMLQIVAANPKDMERLCERLSAHLSDREEVIECEAEVS